MRNFLCICIVLAALAGCKSDIPKNIIKSKKIIGILYDIHIADGYIAGIPNQDSAKRVAASLYKGIYKKFEVDSGLYTRSMNYYYDHPDLLSGIYGKVNEGLKKSKDSLDKIEARRLAKMTAAQKKAKEAATKKLKKDSLDMAKLTMAPELKLTPAEKLKNDSVRKADRLKRIRRSAAAKKAN